MLKTELRILQRLFEGPASLRELSQSLELSYPAVASAAKGLIVKGLCEREKSSVKIKPSAQMGLLGEISTRYQVVKLLGGSKETVLTALLSPLRPIEIAKHTGLAEQTIYRILRELKGMLAVSVKAGKYIVADELLRDWLKLRQMERRLTGEAGVTLLYSNGFVIKMARKGMKVRGTPTAFSRFADFGVDYGAETRDFFVEPPAEISVEEVLVHALLAGQDVQDATMCAVFYLKNRDKIDAVKVGRIAKHLGVLDLWLDLVALCRGLPLKHPEKFLPWDEFVEKAAVYDVSVQPPFKLQKVHELFEKLGAKLEREVAAYCFGGTNLLLAELKEATKDVDIVVEDRESFKALHLALLELGYHTLGKREVSKEEQRLEASGIYVHEALPRVDLFTRRICKAFELTDTMRRGAKAMRFGKLRANFLSLEAVFLLKSITDREGDILDMEAIARHGADWKLLERMYWEEEKLVGARFCLDVLDSLEVIRERSGARIPFLRGLLRRCLEEGVKQSVRLGAGSIADLKRYLDFPEVTLRRAAERLAERREIRLIKRGGRVHLKPISVDTPHE